MKATGFTSADRETFQRGAGSPEAALALAAWLVEGVIAGDQDTPPPALAEQFVRLDCQRLLAEGRRELDEFRDGRLLSRWLNRLARPKQLESLKETLRQAAGLCVEPEVAAGLHRLARAAADQDQERLTTLPLRLQPEWRRLFNAALVRLRRIPGAARSASDLRGGWR